MTDADRNKVVNLIDELIEYERRLEEMIDANAFPSTMLAAEATAAPAKGPHSDLLAPLQHGASPCPAQSRPASKLSLPKARPVDRLKESAHER